MLPELSEVDAASADIAWLVYDLAHNPTEATYMLTHHRTIYTEFAPALDAITKTEAGAVEDFIKVLQKKLKQLRKGEPVADSTPASESLE